MNKYDSEIVAGILTQNGYRQVFRSEEADILLVNTCSVREHAETRALGRADNLSVYKKQHPGRQIGVLGCMVQNLGEKILAEHPAVDFVVAPDSYRHLPQILKQNLRHSRGEFSVRAFLDDSGSNELYDDVYPKRVEGISAWIAVMRGCNNFCAYCIVPYVRGRERSRPAEHVVDEVKKLVDEGFVEVTLLGQNVNSYDDGRHDFPDLLEMVAQVEGLLRVRFATSHPKDLSEKLVRTIASHPKICRHIHLPVQSGSTRILKAMNRGYTRETYLRKVDLIRRCIPDVGLTTDIIVGFPGETREDFEATKSLVKEVEYDGAFIFKYSPRPHTPAARMKETLTEEEKIQRLQELNAIQKEISLRKNRAHIGQTAEILIEGPSKRSLKDAMGRLENNKIVILPNTKLRPGALIPVRITEVRGVTLFGERIDGKTTPKTDADEKEVPVPVIDKTPLVNEME